MMPNYTTVAAIAGLGLVGGAVGVVIGGEVGGPIGMAVGAVVGVVIGVGVGVAAYLVSRGGRIEVERADIAQERARLVEEETAFDPGPEPEVELTPQGAEAASRVRVTAPSAAIVQPTQELKADKEALQQEERKGEARKTTIDSQKKENEKEEKTIDQSLIERKEIAAFIDGDIVRVGIEKINAVKNVVDLMLRANMPLEQIKSVVKTSFKSIHLFFEDELRDPVTDELLLDDCVLGPDGRHYNRSTMVNVYNKNPAELKTDEAFLAKLRLFQEGGSSEALSVSSPGSPAPMSEECLSEGSEESDEPSTRINKTSMPSQADPSKNKTFLKAPTGYCALFFPRQKAATLTPGKKPHPLDIGIVVERQATSEQALPEVVI